MTVRMNPHILGTANGSSIRHHRPTEVASYRAIAKQNAASNDNVTLPETNMTMEHHLFFSEIHSAHSCFLFFPSFHLSFRGKKPNDLPLKIRGPNLSHGVHGFCGDFSPGVEFFWSTFKGKFQVKAEELKKPWLPKIWAFPKIGVPQNGWFIMENRIKMDDLGVPLFSETSIACWWFFTNPCWKICWSSNFDHFPQGFGVKIPKNIWADHLEYTNEFCKLKKTTSEKEIQKKMGVVTFLKLPP